ncbi:hypothetical protein GJAV_G00248750 [Gymnothorax javanicus]|nr:hypothetical protein GJAV_G00248750 [Gymnothorax javanicus]
MSNCVAFHTQIASIMEVLANAAVAEICKLVDDGYAVLRLEMSQSQKENESLRRKLQVLEMRLAQACDLGDKTRTKDISVNSRPKKGSVLDKFQGSSTAELDSITAGRSPSNSGLGSDGEPNEDQDDSVLKDSLCSDMEEGSTESVLIKEESVEEDSDTPGVMNNNQEGLSELRNDAGKMAAALSNRTPSSKGRETLTDQQRTRRHVWEDADVDAESLVVKEERAREEGIGSSPPRGDPRISTERAVERGIATGGRETPPSLPGEEPPEQHSTMGSLWDVPRYKTGGVQKAKRTRITQGLQRRGTEHRAETLSSSDSEFALFERSGQQGSYCTQGGDLTETEDPCCSYSTERNPQSLSFHSELQRGSAVDRGSGKNLAALSYIEWTPPESGPVKVGMPSAWNRPGASGTVLAMPKSYNVTDEHDDHDGEGEKAGEENVSSVSQVRERGGESVADLNGGGLLQRSYGVSENMRADHAFSTGGGPMYRTREVPLQIGDRHFSCPQCGKLFAHPGRLKGFKRRLRTMADSSAFRAQLASIMEVLANTAVAEICQLVDDGYAVLRLEMTRSYKENEVLRRKLKSLELNSSGIRGSKRPGSRNVSGLAVAAQGSCSFPKGRVESYMPAVESVFGQQMDVTFDRNQQSTHCEEPPVVSRDQKERTDVLDVKEERLEDSGTSVPLEEKIRAERSVDWRAGSREKRPTQETQNKAENHTQERTEQPRTRHAIWEVSGLDSSLKAEPGDNGVNEADEHFRYENDAEEPYHLDSGYFTPVRSSQRGALITPEVRQTEAEDSAESYVPVTDPENLAVELVEVTPALNGCDSSNMYFITSEGRFAHYKDIPRKNGYVCKYCGKHFARRNVLIQRILILKIRIQLW